MQIVIQNYVVNEFIVPSLKTELLLLPEIAKSYGLGSRMQLSERIALLQKLDTIKKMLVIKVIKLVTGKIDFSNARYKHCLARVHFCSLKELKLIFTQQ